MGHGIVDVFAYQEALLIEAVFGVALLVMLWVGFRRWLQHKENMGRLTADRSAEVGVQNGARMEQVEARLKAVEQVVAGGGALTAVEAQAIPANALADPIVKDDEA